ncbi:MAG: flagellar motor switch protein FliN [Pseudomonadota bacterium]
MADGMNPEDFGLGQEFDQAISDSQGGESHAETDRAKNLAGFDDARASKTDFSKLKMILDVPLKVSVELGRTKMLINDLLQLGQGSVIELDKIAGEPMEILINNKLVALGEVVVVNEKFGVRLTDVTAQFGLGQIGNLD